MIFGIGVDVTSVSRIRKVHDRFGVRFARRILDTVELAEYTSKSNKTAFLAKRFAIKEAASKALGTGERAGVLLKHFFITHDRLGKPQLRLTGHAKTLASEYKIATHHVSVSDERDTVVAFVIFECQ